MMRNKIAIVITCILLFFSSLSAKEAVSFNVKGESAVFAFAVEELKSFLSTNYEFSDKTAKWEFNLQTDITLSEGSFRVRHQSAGNKQQLFLTGSDETAILHAVYTSLEKAGMQFEISGPVFHKNLDLNRLKGCDVTINPKVKQRGIRQHINFTMDISSYPLEEAKDYIRNLARLRFNHITFHSYPGQWYSDPASKTPSYAGNFFYGKIHDIPEDKLLQEKIRNKKTFCIPEIEPFWDDRVKREKMAIEWLQAVMDECKRAGLTVRFSFESRGSTPDIQKTEETVKRLLTYYPLINELEIITSETVSTNATKSREEIARMLTPLYGPEIMEDAVVMKPLLTGSSGIAGLFATIGHNIRALDLIDSTLLKSRGIKGSLGLYVADPEFLEASFHLLRKYAPEASYAVLPGHGSSRVARYLPYADMKKEDWQKTMVYSWLEFDGIMYLQQNGIRGIRSLIEYGEDMNGLDPLQSICFNHWRTAENRVTARYAAESTLFGAMDEDSFYRHFCETYGIENTTDFTKALKQIDAAGWYATNELPNVAFSYALGNNAVGFGFLRNMKPAKLKQGRELYANALVSIQSCLSSVKTKEGREFLELLENRLKATDIYFKAFEKGVEIQQFDEKNLTEDSKRQIALILNETLSGFNQFIRMYSEMMPDRGCEGTIISAYYVRIDALKKMRLALCGIPYEASLPAPESLLHAKKN